MAENVKNLYEELYKVRQYLIKIGPERRKGNISKVKLEEAENLAKKYDIFVDRISKVIHSLSQSERQLIQKYCEKFNFLYLEIKELCGTTPRSSDSGSDQYEEIPVTMEKFDLKVALTLLPVMTDENLKELINGIEYYGSILDENSKTKLISFVLSTRLSNMGKLKLSSSYSTIEELTRDMRVQLLPKKSATAIHTKLQYAKQNDKTIADFGKDLTEMFVDLTISQADGNSDSYNILRPLNEKIAIKRFSDGLRNRRLSTIIAARDYSSLKDAVQAAQEEETSSSLAGAAEVMGMYRQPRRQHFPQRTHRGPRGQRGPQRYFRGKSSQYYRNPPEGRQWAPQMYRGRSFQRGRFNGFRGNSSRGAVNVCAPQSEPAPDDPNIESLNHFFRT